MKWLFTILIALSFLFGTLNNKIDLVGNAIISEGTNAIELAITLGGSMCVWCGIMRIAKKSGLTTKISSLLSPSISLLFKNIEKSTVELIAMNFTANLFGLGNAATPLGLAAMGELAKSSKDGVATNNMILLVVINTASLQLIPTTVATMRLKYGATTPLDILPCVLLSSIVALTVAITMVIVLNHLSGKREHL